MSIHTHRRPVLSVIGMVMCLLAMGNLSPVATAQDVPLESCFRYYTYGKVSVDISSQKPQYTSSDTIRLSGAIVNDNSFPLTDLVLYAHLKRINGQTYEANGHHLVDRLTLQEDLSMLPHETKHIDIDLPVKPGYRTGSYEIQYFVFTKDGFHYGGLPFLEETYAGSTSLSLDTDRGPDVYFDIDRLLVQGQTRPIRSLTTEFSDPQISLDVRLVDNREVKKGLPVTIKIYSFEDSLETTLVQQARTVWEDTASPLHFEFSPKKKGAYVALFELDPPYQSILKYRFAATSGQSAALQLSSVGVSEFPTDEDTRAWVCVHSPNNEYSPLTKISLALIDSQQKIVDQIDMTGTFSPEVQAISLPLSKLTSPDDFTIEAQIIDPRDSTVIKKSQIHYGCDLFTSSLVDFTIVQNPQNSREVLVQGTNRCGVEVTEGKISLLRVSRGGEVEIEQTNTVGLPHRVSLAELPSGTHVVDVTIGGAHQRLTVYLPEVPKRAGANNVLLTLSIVALIVVLVSIVSLSIWYLRNSS